MPRILFILILLVACFAFSSCASNFTNIGFKALQRGDYERAYSLSLYAARNGEPAAMNNMGVLWENGFAKETPQNYTEAINWYTMAANRGQIQSMANLARVLRKKGLMEESAQWYTTAARWGNLEAINFFREMKVAPPPADLLHGAIAREQEADAQASAALAAALIGAAADVTNAVIEARHPPPAPPPQEIRVKTNCTKIGGYIHCD